MNRFISGHTPNTVNAIVPLGVQEKVTVEKLRASVVNAIAFFRQQKTGGTLQLLSPTFLPHIADDVIAETVAQSALLSNYAFDRYVGKPGHAAIDEIVLAGFSETFADPLKEIHTLCCLNQMIKNEHSRNH